MSNLPSDDEGEVPRRTAAGDPSTSFRDEHGDRRTEEEPSRLPPQLRSAARGRGGSQNRGRRGSDITQVLQAGSAEREAAMAAAPAAADYQAARQARWSRNPDQLRGNDTAQELERRLVASCVLDDDFDEEDEDDEGGLSRRESAGSQPVELSGFLTKKTGAFSGHKRRYFVLKGGTILWYKSEKDSSPTGYCHLVECTLMDPKTDGPNKDGLYPFSIRAATKEYQLQADDASDRDRWMRALRHNASAPPLPGLAPPKAPGLESDRHTDSGLDSYRSSHGEGSEPSPTNTKQKKSLFGSLALRAEKRMAGRAVTSDLGKKLLREYCLPETFVMLEAIREIVSKDKTLPAKTGAKIEDTILRLAVKVALLYQHHRLVPRDFDPSVRIIDRLCINMVRKFDVTRPPPHRDMLDEDHEEMHEQFDKLEGELCRLLTEHISPKNIGALRGVLQYLGAPDNLSRFLVDPRCSEELGKIANSLRVMYQLV